MWYEFHPANCKAARRFPCAQERRRRNRNNRVRVDFGVVVDSDTRLRRRYKLDRLPSNPFCCGIVRLCLAPLVSSRKRCENSAECPLRFRCSVGATYDDPVQLRSRTLQRLTFRQTHNKCAEPNTAVDGQFLTTKTCTCMLETNARRTWSSPTIFDRTHSTLDQLAPKCVGQLQRLLPESRKARHAKLKQLLFFTFGIS